MLHSKRDFLAAIGGATVPVTLAGGFRSGVKTQTQPLTLEYRTGEITEEDIPDALDVEPGDYRWFAVEAAITESPGDFSTDPLFNRAFLGVDGAFRMADGLRSPSGEMTTLVLDRDDAPDVTLETGDRVEMYYRAATSAVPERSDPELEWDLQELDVLYDVEAQRID